MQTCSQGVEAPSRVSHWLRIELHSVKEGCKHELSQAEAQFPPSPPTQSAARPRKRLAYLLNAPPEAVQAAVELCIVDD